MTRTGLVLGAGGIVGQAFQAGVLATLEQEVGWDPRSAEVIVGSSAGSVTGATLRLGVVASDLAARASGDPVSAHGAAFFAAVDGADEALPVPSVGDLLHGWHLPSPALVTRTLRRPWAARPAAIASSLLPSGRYDLRERTQVLDGFRPGWPPGLLICAARQDDGRRVVFGRPGAPYALLSEAVAASCAIPSYFAPVPIGGRHHVDGGVHSATNADVLSGAGLDLVIVVSSMSAAHGASRAADAGLRWALHRRLEREIRRLRARGTEVVRFEPGPDSLAAMGLNAMAEDRSAAVVEVARRDALAHATSARSTRRLAPLLAASRSRAA
jgi:NTE family protein